MKLWLSALILPLLACHPDEEAAQRNFSSFQPEEDAEVPVDHILVATRQPLSDGLAVTSLVAHCEADYWSFDVETSQRPDEAEVLVQQQGGGSIRVSLAPVARRSDGGILLNGRVPIFEGEHPAWDGVSSGISCQKIDPERIDILIQLWDWDAGRVVLTSFGETLWKDSDTFDDVILWE